MIDINLKQYLLEWMINYLKNKDIFVNKIVNIETDKGGFDAVITYKEKIQYLLVVPVLDDMPELFEKLDDNSIMIITLNSKGNLYNLQNNWDKLSKFKNLVFYFVNPFSNLEKKWMIYPYTHNRICDPKSLKQGLNSIFETVEEISEEILKSKI